MAQLQELGDSLMPCTLCKLQVAWRYAATPSDVTAVGRLRATDVPVIGRHLCLAVGHGLSGSSASWTDRQQSVGQLLDCHLPLCCVAPSFNIICGCQSCFYDTRSKWQSLWLEPSEWSTRRSSELASALGSASMSSFCVCCCMYLDINVSPIKHMSNVVVAVAPFVAFVADAVTLMLLMLPVAAVCVDCGCLHNHGFNSLSLRHVNALTDHAAAQTNTHTHTHIHHTYICTCV